MCCWLAELLAIALLPDETDAEKVGYRLEARLKKIVFKDGAVCDQLLFVRLRED